MKWNAILAAAAALGLMVGSANAQTKLDMTNEYEPGSIHGQGDQFFADKVKELSGGTVTITLHLGGSLGFKSADNLDAVGDGVVPIADTLGGVLAGSDPVFLVSSLPFIVANPDEARTLYKVAKPAYEKFFEEHNQILLYASPWPASGFWANKPVVSSDDLKGLKLRTYDANGTRTLIAAGAAPIQLSWADVVPQLATGGIDGVLTSAEGGVNSKFWEQLSDFTEINYALPLNFVHMNADIFNQLDEKQQDAIMKAATESDQRNWDALQERVQQNYKALREHDVTITEKVPEEFQKFLSDAGKTVVDEWRQQAGEAGEAILKEYGAQTGRSF